MNYNFKQELYEDIKEESGVYIIELYNGKQYIGSSRNIKNRLNSHYWNLKNGNSYVAAWYYQAYLDLDLMYKEKSFEELIDNKIIFKVLYVNEEDARKIEKEILAEILLNNLVNKYYNTEYFRKVNEEYQRVIVPQYETLLKEKKRQDKEEYIRKIKERSNKPKKKRPIKKIVIEGVEYW